MRIPRPLSSEALGLIALGPVDTEGSTLQTEKVRFHALCPSSGEPLLLNGLLMQVGDQYVVKHTPAVATLDVVQSVVQRVSVYRDEWEGDWATLVESPLRAIVACVPVLKTCFPSSVAFHLRTCSSPFLATVGSMWNRGG